MQRVDSLEKILMLGGIGGRGRRGQQSMRWLDGITDLMDMGLRKLWVFDGWGGLACCDSWGHKESDMTERLNWTELNLNPSLWGGGLGENAEISTLRYIWKLLGQFGAIWGNLILTMFKENSQFCNHFQQWAISFQKSWFHFSVWWSWIFISFKS